MDVAVEISQTLSHEVELLVSPRDEHSNEVDSHSSNTSDAPPPSNVDDAAEISQLPPDFNADAFTALRTRGNLIFVTVNMFLTFRVIESIVASHFNPIGQIYVTDSLQICIGKISKASILKLFCDVHRDHHLPYLIREYVGVRYHFESLRLKNLLLSQSKAKVKENGKLSKHA